jgi:hypothetical protein
MGGRNQKDGGMLHSTLISASRTISEVQALSAREAPILWSAEDSTRKSASNRFTCISAERTGA